MTARGTIAAVLVLIAGACGGTDGLPAGPAVPAGSTTGAAAAPEVVVAESPTTTATTTVTATTTPLRSFTMAFTGDFLLHNRVNSSAAANAADDPSRKWDYRPMLEHISPWITAADWAVCQMEVNLSTDGTRLSSYPAFRAPGQIAFDAKELGYDSCTLASNHILDHGVAGVAETLEVLDEAGLHATGAARSAAEASDQRSFDLQGVRVAHLAYSYWFNGIELPSAAPWTSNPIDEEQILLDAADARLNGAEFVVASLHWGEQYSNQPNRQQRDLGPRLLASTDIDLIIGHHAHVVQPIEQIDGEWLVYGLGNLLSNSGQPIRRDQLLVTATIREQSDGSFTSDLEVLPLYLDHATLTVYPSGPTTRPGAISADLRDRLEASYARVLAVLESGDSPVGFTVD